MIAKLVSGGQTGVDRAALDAALARGFPCGGWCPQGRRAEDGTIPDRYPLIELHGAGYLARTLRNVDDSDGTLIVHFGAPSGGTKRTWRHCVETGKPHLLVDGRNASVASTVEAAAEFCVARRIAVLNVAGPRASGEPRAYDYALAVIDGLLERFEPEPSSG